ncbi:MAG: HAD family hydrolase [Oscillospiraceae bacterium]
MVCFGDAVNDIPMFKEADECYAVSNASPALLQVADGIIGEAGGDGVAAWLADRFLQDSQWGAPLESFRK